jgi:hypothetical protein
MFTLVRINLPSTVRDPDGRVVTHINPDYVWDHVLKNHGAWRSKEVKILYMTRRHLQEDTSLIVDSTDADTLADFLLKHIATIRYVRGIWVINMAKMRFFILPIEQARDFLRFTITVNAKPDHLQRIYDEVSSFEPGRDVMINYIAQSFQSFSESIMVSALARGRKHVDAFVNECLRPIDGVLGVEVTQISKSIRLVSQDEWLESVGPLRVAPGGKRLKEIDTDHDDTLMASC